MVVTCEEIKCTFSFLPVVSFYALLRDDDNRRGKTTIICGNKKDHHNNYKTRYVRKLQSQKTTEYCKEPKQKQAKGELVIALYHWSCLYSTKRSKIVQYIGQFQVTVFSRFCYVLFCNHEYIHCLNHRQAKYYITRRNETKRKLKFERRHCK